MSYKGYIVDTIEAYELKQAEIANIIGLAQGVRYAGRIDDNGNIKPDIILIDGRFAIPYEQGTDTINDNQLPKIVF